MKFGNFEIFPMDKRPVNLSEAYMYLLLFGYIGVHQFYLGNRKKALFICCISVVTIIWIWARLPYPFTVVKAGFGLVALMLIWDFFTLYWQVRKKSGIINPF